MLALTLFGIFFVIALAGVPLLYSILITTTGIIALQGLGHPLETIFLSFIGGVEPFILLAVPLFIFAGELLAQGLAAAGAPRRTLAFEPAGKVLAIFVGVRGEQHALTRGIDADVGGQHQRVLAVQQRAAELLLEAQQLLAQVAARVGGVRPQHRCCTQPADAGLQRRQGQQRGGAPLEQHRRRTVRQHRSVTAQAQVPTGLWQRLVHARMIAESGVAFAVFMRCARQRALPLPRGRRHRHGTTRTRPGAVPGALVFAARPSASRSSLPQE